MRSAKPVVAIANKAGQTWRRVSLSVFGIIIIVTVWRWSLGPLYALPQYSIAAFSSITASAFYVIGVITVFLVTGLTFFSWSQSTSLVTAVGQAVSAATNRNGLDDDGDDDNDDRRSVAPKHFDDHDTI